MRTPELNRLVETFVRIGTPAELSRDRHFSLLRTLVAPLIRDLRARNLIGWFSFLVHDRNSGVPTTPNDEAVYLHLRLERLDGVDFDTLVSALPQACVFTQAVAAVDARSLEPADHTALVVPEVATGWALFGASSEWALDFACAHRNDRSVPLNNLRQFLHYLGNQLLIRTTNIPMP
jgi:hypothetical protein